MAVTVRPLTEAVGVEVIGVDLKATERGGVRRRRARLARSIR